MPQQPGSSLIGYLLVNFKSWSCLQVIPIKCLSKIESTISLIRKDL